MLDAIKEQVRSIAAAVLKLDAADLDSSEPLDRYGLDSLTT